MTLKYAIDSLSALLTPIIAVLALWIAFGQYKTNANMLRLSLYKKRYRVYEALRGAMSEIFRDARLSNEGFNKFWIDTNESEFLFGSEINEYIKTFQNKAAQLRSVTSQLYEENLPIGEKRTKLAQEKSDLLKWFSDEFKAIKKTFNPYLKFDR